MKLIRILPNDKDPTGSGSKNPEKRKTILLKKEKGSGGGLSANQNKHDFFTGALT